MQKSLLHSELWLVFASSLWPVLLFLWECESWSHCEAWMSGSQGRGAYGDAAWKVGLPPVHSRRSTFNLSLKMSLMKPKAFYILWSKKTNVDGGAAVQRGSRLTLESGFQQNRTARKVYSQRVYCLCRNLFQYVNTLLKRVLNDEGFCYGLLRINTTFLMVLGSQLWSSRTVLLWAPKALCHWPAKP